MSKPIVVLGAAGNVGNPLVEVLSRGGATVRAGLRNRKKMNSALQWVDWVDFDFSKPADYSRVVAGADQIFLNLPASPTMVEVTRNVVEAATKAEVKKIVKLSAAHTHPNSAFTFGRWHFDADECVKNSGIPYTILRPTGFMQNFINMSAGTIRSQNRFYNAMGLGAVAYIDTRDIARVAATALLENGHAGKIYDLTGPQALTMKHLAKVFTDILGRVIEPISVTPSQAAQGMIAHGAPEWLANGVASLFTLYAEGREATVTSTVQAVTGKTATSFETFVEEFKSHF